jgi:prepilin-type processing-associated H-X9-DG protein
MIEKERARSDPSRGHVHFLGFTLIDLVVAVAVIALLLAMLLPSMSAARRMADQTVCRSNLRQVGLALLSCQSKYHYFPLAADSAHHDWQNGVQATWIDVLIQLGFLGDHRVGYCPSDARPDPLNAARGEAQDRRYPGLPEPTLYGADYSYGLSRPLELGTWSLLGQPDYPRINLESNSAARLLVADGYWPQILNLSGDALARGDGNPLLPSPEDNMVGYRHPRTAANVLFVDTHVEAIEFDPSRPATGVDTARVFIYYHGESVNEPSPDWLRLPSDYPLAIRPAAISDYGPHGGWTNPQVHAHKGWDGY